MAAPTTSLRCMWLIWRASGALCISFRASLILQAASVYTICSLPGMAAHGSSVHSFWCLIRVAAQQATACPCTIALACPSTCAVQWRRQMAAGDQLRVVYDQLSRDPASLSNLDQDLPNYAQHQVPIFSLPQVLDPLPPANTLHPGVSMYHCIRCAIYSLSLAKTHRRCMSARVVLADYISEVGYLLMRTHAPCRSGCGVRHGAAMRPRSMQRP